MIQYLNMYINHKINKVEGIVIIDIMVVKVRCAKLPQFPWNSNIHKNELFLLQ